MLLRDAIHFRLEHGTPDPSDGLRPKLPRSLKIDRVNVRTGMFQRLASSRQFALGDRSGVLRTAQKRSGRSFRLDVRQRVIVKALVSRHAGAAAERAAALGKHLAYLGRVGAGVEGARPEFFERNDSAVDPTEAVSGWGGDRHHFRFIIAPEHGERLADMRGYVREVMDRVSADLGEPNLRWIAICHFDTDQPHAHVLVRGRRANGRDLVIPRGYIGYGFRARAQEVAQERLGDLSRPEAERRIWKETEADRLTGFDRRLIAAADASHMVEDGVGVNDAWAALTRGRLRHLERLGLATRIGRRYQLDADVATKLRTLQVRRDIIRTLNQRRLEGAHDVRPIGLDRVRGTVVKTGFHDEAGASPFVVVRDSGGVEHYARLRAGSPQLALGKTATLQPLSSGIAQVMAGRGADLSR